MKILYWSPYVGHVGTIKAVINSAIAMRRYGGYKVTIIKNHTEWEGYEDRISKSGVNIEDFGLKKWFPNLHLIKVLGSRLYMITVAVFGFFQLLVYMKKEKPDVLITNLISIPAILATRFLRMPPRIVASIQGFPKFLRTEEHHTYPAWMKLEDAIRRKLWNLVYVYADLLVCMTSNTMEKLIAQTTLPADRFKVINNPVIDDEIFIMSEERLDDHWLFDGSHKRVVAIGRLTRQKDFLSLIRAIEIAGKVISLRLCILGEGEDRQLLEEEIYKRNLGKQIRLYGFVANPYAYLKNADLFVLSSLWEDPGHAILEAAALRVPIVSTDCPSGPAALLSYGAGGELCPIGDVECLARKIIATLSGGSQSEKVQIAYDNAYRFSLKSHFSAYRQYLNTCKEGLIGEN